MGNVNALISERLKKSDQSSKMAVMAKQTAEGQRSSFAGVFSVSEISENEKNFLENLLKNYSNNEANQASDLNSLIALTLEVKAINNQAAILHGERIKKVHALLTPYRDGAFSSWLIATYGNRQTPYNFMQYYEFYEAMPKILRPRIETMPKQAVYALASREGLFEKKIKIVEKYNGEPKTELLREIRHTFPLSAMDKRQEDVGEMILGNFKKAYAMLQKSSSKLSKSQKKEIEKLAHQLCEFLKQ